MSYRLVWSALPSSPSLNECSRDAHLAWPHFFLLGDNHGRFNADPKVVRATLFPCREDVSVAEVQRWLEESARAGMVQLYSVGGRRFGSFLKFEKYQPGASRFKRRPSEYPDPNGAVEKPAARSVDLADVTATARRVFPGASVDELQKDLPSLVDIYGKANVEFALGEAERRRAKTRLRLVVATASSQSKRLISSAKRRSAGR